MKKIDFPSLSIIIVTKNNQRTLPRLLKDLASQDYPKKKIEIIFVDGKSTDKTIELIKKSKLNIKLITGKVPNDPEVCKGEGLANAKGTYVGLIDSDNYFPNKEWFSKMIRPLEKDKSLVGSYAWRFAYRKSDNNLNRYFSLIGSADPVGLYLGKADKMSYLSDKWVGFGKVIESYRGYFIVQFDERHFPTLGSNGFFARRAFLLKGKASANHFFHIDVPFDILKLNLNKYAIIKDVVIHDTAVSLKTFILKRIRYMRLHYQKRAAVRRYRVFDPHEKRDVFKLALFMFYSFTFFQPLYVAIRGYFKIKDTAWFLHPIFCFSIALAYSVAIVSKYFEGIFKHD
jgi:glycosyltransferase involved in cell wall biosynthesis